MDSSTEQINKVLRENELLGQIHTAKLNLQFAIDRNEVESATYIVEEWKTLADELGICAPQHGRQTFERPFAEPEKRADLPRYKQKAKLHGLKYLRIPGKGRFYEHSESLGDCMPVGENRVQTPTTKPHDAYRRPDTPRPAKLPKAKRQAPTPFPKRVPATDQRTCKPKPSGVYPQPTSNSPVKPTTSVKLDRTAGSSAPLDPSLDGASHGYKHYVSMLRKPPKGYGGHQSPRPFGLVPDDEAGYLKILSMGFPLPKYTMWTPYMTIGKAVEILLWLSEQCESFVEQMMPQKSPKSTESATSLGPSVSLPESLTPLGPSTPLVSSMSSESLPSQESPIIQEYSSPPGSWVSSELLEPVTSSRPPASTRPKTPISGRTRYGDFWREYTGLPTNWTWPSPSWPRSAELNGWSSAKRESFYARKQRNSSWNRPPSGPHNRLGGDRRAWSYVHWRSIGRYCDDATHERRNQNRLDRRRSEAQLRRDAIPHDRCANCLCLYALPPPDGCVCHISVSPLWAPFLSTPPSATSYIYTDSRAGDNGYYYYYYDDDDDDEEGDDQPEPGVNSPTSILRDVCKFDPELRFNWRTFERTGEGSYVRQTATVPCLFSTDCECNGDVEVCRVMAL